MYFSDISEITQDSNHLNQDLTEKLVAEAIAGVVGVAQANGRSLQELTEEVLIDDQVLDQPTRNWLCKVVSKAWDLSTTDSESLPNVA